MTRTIRTALAATMLATGLAASPALAGGSVSLSYNPTNPDEAQALQTGLRIYGLVKGIQDGSITQNGIGNTAGLAQNGSGNLGIVHQEGNGHTGTIQQNGNGNAHGLFQFGENTEGHVVQNGNGQAGVTAQFGW